MESKSLQILVIEDDPRHVSMLRKMLAASDPPIVLRSAGTLEDGVNSIREVRYDLILLDLGLPDSDGFATFATVIAVSGSCPVVVLTGNADTMLADEMVKLGAQDYLLKTQLTPYWLDRSIRHAIQRASAERERRSADVDLEKRIRERTLALHHAHQRLSAEIDQRLELEKKVAELEGKAKKASGGSGGVGAAARRRGASGQSGEEEGA
jgi:DNA-binding NtrC family response regulator